MLDYLHAMTVISVAALAAGTPAMGLALYLSPRITSRIARMAIVWPLLVVGVTSLAFVTVVLGYNLFAFAILIIRGAFGAFA